MDMYVTVPMHPDYPAAECSAWHVYDGSMNAAKPVPFLRNHLAICVSTDFKIENNKIYIIRCRSEDGRYEEFLIRRAKLHNDHSDLSAESQSPDCFEPITIPGTLDTDPTQRVCAIALVYGSFAFC